MWVTKAGRPAVPHTAADSLVRADIAPAIGILMKGILRLPPEIILASLCINFSSLLLPLVVMQVYDRVVPNHSTETLLLLSMMTLGVMMVEAVIRTTRAHLVFWSATRQAWTVHHEAMSRLLNAPPSWWAGESPSRIVDRIKAINSVAEWQSSPSRMVLLDVPFVIVFLGLMAVTGGALVLVPILVFATVGFMIWREGMQLRRSGTAVAVSDMRVNDFLAESLSGVLAIKGNALEAQMQRRFERLQNASAHCTDEHVRSAEQARAHADLMAAVAQVLTMAAGAAFVMADSLSVGTLACCTLLAGRALQPLLRCAAMWTEIQSMAVDRGKAEPIERLPPAEPQLPGADDGPLGVRLASVTAGTSDIHPGLDQADLVVAPGEMLALIGVEGPGTSPLGALLTGRLAPLAGNVTFLGDPGRPVGGRPRRILSVSPQHRPIDGTILDNLAGFRIGPAIAAGCEAARLIGLDEDVNLLTAGYATRVGSTLSNDVPDSIVRRIAIARAIAARPGLLILDCANEGLDTVAEKRLSAGLRTLRGRITVVILTNRPSFAALADTVYRIHDGRFVRDDALASGREPPA